MLSNESAAENVLARLSHAIVIRDFVAVRELTDGLIQAGVDPFRVLNYGLIPGMYEASGRFRKGEFYIPEMLMSSRALKIGLDILKPLIRARNANDAGRVVIGTVQYDLHDIGKNMIISLLTGHGFEVIDLGVDVSPQKFVRAVEKNEARILAMSALLTSTMLHMKATIEALHAAGLGEVKVLVGGAPVTPIFAQKIGADAYCREAYSAPAVARKLVGLDPNVF